jgi:hypothetical protein
MFLSDDDLGVAQFYLRGIERLALKSAEVPWLAFGIDRDRAAQVMSETS